MVYCVCSYDSIEVLVGCIEIECVVIVLVVLLVSCLRHIQLRKSLSLVEEEEDEKHLAAMLDLLCMTTVLLWTNLIRARTRCNMQKLQTTEVRIMRVVLH